MGGKEKKGQRTKGNVKPSSSGRSAELLGNVSGFVGFTGLPEGAYVPVLNVGTSANEETDFNIPGDFRLTLRKMGKKDSTTKIKALNEFVDLCSQSSVDVLKCVLPFWPRIYAKLAIDNDRRVRENGQKAHHQIASKLGRNLAPQLKELMGVWFTSQCDTYTPASIAASQSLKACFPENKLPEAIAFCHSEIMGYINDCLFKNEDIQEEQKERVHVGALSGYSLLLQQMQKTEIEQESRFEKHCQLWREPNLYKVVEKNSSSVLKQAWFRMMLTVSQTSPQLVQENASKILPCLFSFLDDTDSLTQSSMWETALKLLLMVDNAASYVNFSSSVIPRFLNLLRNGCYGNASTVGPLVLPLTQLLRDSIKPQHRDSLNVQLIASLRQGFSDKAIATSTVEAAAFSSTFAQLLNFAAQNIAEASGLRKLIESQIISLLDSLIQAKRSDIVLGHLMCNLTLVLYRWFDNLDVAAEEFWTALDAYIRKTLTQTPHPEASVVQQLCLVLSILMDPTFKADRERRQPMTRPGRIRFNETDADINSRQASAPTTVTIPSALGDKLNGLCVSLCQKALECSQQSQCQTCLDLLTCLLRHDSVTQQFLASQSLSPQQMISSFIQPVLEQLHDSASASLLFTLLNAVEGGQRLQLLEEIIHDQSTCLTLATTALEKFTNKETVREWLHGHQIQSLLATTTQQLSTFSHEDPAAAWNLIKAALSARIPSHDQELVLPESHIDAVLSALTGCLTADNVSQNPFEQLTNPLCALWQSAARSVYSFESVGRFLDAIFDALCSNISFPEESLDDLMSIWNTGAAFNALPRTSAAAKIMKRHLMTNPDTEIVDRFLLLFAQISRLVENDESEPLRSLINLILPDASEWESLANESNAVHLMAKELLSGSVYFADFTGHFKPVQLASWCHLIKVAFVTSDVAIRVKAIENQRRIVHLLFYAAASAQLLLNLFSKRSQDAELLAIRPLVDRLNANLDILLTECSPAEQLEIYKTATSMASEDKGWIWTSVARKLQSICDIRVPNVDSWTPILTDSDGMRNMTVRSLMDRLACLTEAQWKESRQLLTSIRIFLNSLKTEAEPETLDAVVATVQTLQHWQQQYSEEFLFGADLKSLPQRDTSGPLAVVEIIRFLSTVVELYPNQLPNQLWDFVLCSMTSWCSTLEDSWSDWGPNHIHSAVLLSFTVALSRLVLNCSNLVGEVQQKKRDTLGLPPNLIGEWEDVFSEAAFSAIVPIFWRLSQRWNKINNPVLDYVMECLVASLIHVPKQHLHQTVGDLGPLLLSKQPGIQLGAYSLIVKLLPDLASSEAELMASEATDEQEKTERVPPHVLLELLQKTTPEGLDDVRVGDLHLVEPYSEECTRLIAHCLTWKLVLNLCGCSGSELRYQYAVYLANSGLISQLMDDLIRIIPHAAQQHSVDLERELQPQVTITPQVVQDLATQVYTSALRHLPAVIRRWWNNADKRTASLVEKFTAKCVSPVLCSSDLQHVSSTWDNMTVRVRLTAREAIATYKLNEEASMELVVQLPPNYPLGNITVEGGRKVGVTTSQWRTWMLQLTTFLMHQNGSILEGLTLWKRNVDKRFEGIEECYICYYVLHGSNYQLPKLTCRTCRKKFHAACLYKWFSTSNNSTCPLCRNLF